MDRFRCIHCDAIYPRQRASVVPLPATPENPIPIGVCDREDCKTTHATDFASAKNKTVVRWRDEPRDYWGTCLDCSGAVWRVRPGTWKGSWWWSCAKCGMRWREEPPDDEVARETGQ